MVQATVALRIDVDTRRGLRDGVPRLLQLLHDSRISASFFVTMGPDRSGVALRRAWRPAFVLKMLRTNPLRLYGLRTVLSGTLLRPLPVGCGSADLLRQIVAEGHELAIHGYDHFGWQNRVHRMSPRAVLDDVQAAVSGFEEVFGSPPAASAAPGWRTTDTGLQIQERYGFRYASDVRGTTPFRPEVGGTALKTVQVPTTMPTMDELIGRQRDVTQAILAAIGPGLNLFTAHAEVEGGAHVREFERLVRALHGGGMTLARIADIVDAATREADEHPPVPVRRGRVAGRSDWIAVQGRVTLAEQ